MTYFWKGHKVTIRKITSAAVPCLDMRRDFAFLTELLDQGYATCDPRASCERERQKFCYSEH
jgi:hypothetical protein